MDLVTLFSCKDCLYLEEFVKNDYIFGKLHWWWVWVLFIYHLSDGCWKSCLQRMLNVWIGWKSFVLLYSYKYESKGQVLFANKKIVKRKQLSILNFWYISKLNRKKEVKLNSAFVESTNLSYLQCKPTLFCYF